MNPGEEQESKTSEPREVREDLFPAWKPVAAGVEVAGAGLAGIRDWTSNRLLWLGDEAELWKASLLLWGWRLETQMRKKPIFLWLAVTLLALTCAGGITVGSLALSYQARAEVYELDRMKELARGALIVDAKGEKLGRMSPRNRKFVSLNEVPLHLIHALVATEDERFFEHRGNDLWGMTRAALANMRAGQIRQGGSTITQQLARNVFDLTERDLDRKITEIFLARRIEAAYSKEQILEHYLNRIYFGNGFWGLGAAAEGYFGKEVPALDPGESAMLCGIIRSPNPLSPFRSLSASHEARNESLDRMQRAGYLSAAHCKAWKKSTLEIRKDQRKGELSYVVRRIRQEARELLQGRSLEGLVIESTVEPWLQPFAEWQLEETLQRIENRDDYEHESRAEAVLRDSKSGRASYLQGALVVLDNDTGNVVAAVGSRNGRESEFDRVWMGKRPAGPAFAPFTYLAAFDSGTLVPGSSALDVPIDNREVMIGGRQGILGEWGAESAENRYEGQIPAAWALVRNKMGATVRVGYETGLDEVKDLAKRAGIESRLRDFPNTFLGSSEVNLAELTLAYSVFPNLGWRPGSAGLVRRIRTEAGEVIFDRGAEFETVRVANARSTSQVSHLLTQALPSLPEGIEQFTLQGELGGKSGSAYGFTDHWFVGYNSQYTWGVWIGFDRPREISDQIFSRDTAFVVWHSLAEILDSGEPLSRAYGLREERLCFENCRHCTDPEHTVLTSLTPVLAPESNGLALSSSSAEDPVRAVPIGSGLREALRVTQDAKEPVQPKVPPVVGPDPYGALRGLADPEN